MILPRYLIAASTIAGRGLFLDEPVPRGAVLVAPDAVNRVVHRSELDRLAPDSLEHRSSARWFEDWHSISVDWPDECYLNHSSTPTGLWHLGFVFAAGDLPAGTELTVDYRFLLGSGEVSDFVDPASGAPVSGLSWTENLCQSSQALLDLLSGSAGPVMPLPGVVSTAFLQDRQSAG